MPAMSPTMTEGGIAKWKKKEGEAFEAGEILLEIETDKATMDVEAQDDGVMGKIIVSDGSKGVPVGKVIALLAEEGDDISNLEVPKEDGASAAPAESQQASSAPPPSSSQPSSSAPEPAAAAPKHEGPYHPKSKHPIFPSVLRLLQEHNLSTDVDSLGIKGTGVRGMLTKGDVLAYLGLAKGPMGTYKPPKLEEVLGIVGLERKAGGGAAAKVEEVKTSWTADEARRAIMAGLERQVKPAALPSQEQTFDSILADYIKTPKSTASSTVPPAALPKQPSSSSYLDGLF
ncbi:hypothetical protein FRC01_012782 [Tulasnella sp. 417]|nr:hypothetical protein FRC01_012782 [Tulasnella sp. 417]